MPPTPPLLKFRALLLAGAVACSASPGTSASDGSSSGDSDGAQTTGSVQPTSTGDLPTSTGASTTGAATTSTTGDPTTTVEPETGATTTTLGDTTGAVASTGDAGTTTSTTDSSSTDSSSTGGDAGLGELSGECGLIDAMELESPQPFVFANAIDLGAGGFDEALLTPGGQQMIDEGGLNDGSLKSEVVAFEVLARCDLASLLKTEAKIVYMNPMGKRTDILVEMGGHKVGVSVVRAVGFPKDDPYTVAQAKTILEKKLADIKISSANVAAEDAWIKQILHVVAYGPMHVDSMLAAYEAIDADIKTDTILVISRTDGDDSLLY